MTQNVGALTRPATFPRPLRIIDAFSKGYARIRPGDRFQQRLLGQLRKKAANDDELEDLEDSLRLLLSCINPEERLTVFGRYWLRYIVGTVFDRRQRLTKLIRDHPEILDVPIENPVVVLGFPRSGTTLMQELLLQHPSARGLQPWELMTPFPERDGWKTDPRRARFERNLALGLRYAPGFHAMHPLDAPLECRMLLWSSFMSPSAFLYFGSEEPGRWRRETHPSRITRAYAYHRRQLQYLTWVQPGTHWVLKAPDHAANFEYLLAEYPDARIVQMNRDPLEIVPSLCSMTYYMQYCFVRDQTPERVGAETLERLGRRTFTGRDASHAVGGNLAAPGQICDVEYNDLVRDPVATIEGVYAHFGMEMPVGMKPAMSAWLEKHHGGKRPRHRYSLDQFGLTAADVESAFG